MPGIFGVTKNKRTRNPISLDSLNIHLESSCHKRSDYVNNYISTSIVAFDFSSSKNFYYEINGLEVWIYGDPLVAGFTGEKALEESAIVASHSLSDFSKISAIDGLFSIIILDKRNLKLHIINDRNGLAHLFYGIFENQLVFSSELRAFIGKDIKTSLRRESIDTFLGLNYLIANTTWFHEVHLLPPASVLKWDLENSRLNNITTYWDYKSLPHRLTNKNEDKIVSDLTTLFKEAVEKRVGKEERIGITLSGGLDSRTIFANIPTFENGFTAITRGRKNAGDIKIASEVVKNRKDCQHIIYEMDENNWARGRIEAVIATSGQKNLFDMNALASLPIHKKYFDINLDGAGGDGIFGGAHLKYEDKPDVKERLRNKYFKHTLGDCDNSVQELLQYYNQIHSDQYFYLHERVRRFTIFGSVLGHDYGVVSRFPFLDHQLQEYLYQLPEKTNFKKLYYKMLVKYFPEYFVKIDNLNSGRRLYFDDKINFIWKVIDHAQRKLGYEKYSKKYTDYPGWLKKQDGGLINKYVLPKESPLYEYINYDDVKKVLDEFMRSTQNSTILSRIITLNVFLQYYMDK